MTTFTVSSSDVARCPSRRLDAGHYRPDGSCGCRLTDASRCGIHGRPTRYGRCSSCTPWVHDDGGRAAAGFSVANDAGDCVARAIAIAAELPYGLVYKSLARRAEERGLRRSARDGVPKAVYRPYLEDQLGWTWTATMGIGTGCQVHLTAEELPPGRLVVRLSRHVCAVLDGVVHDTFDPSRDGSRCVYGYWSQP